MNSYQINREVKIDSAIVGENEVVVYLINWKEQSVMFASKNTYATNPGDPLYNWGTVFMFKETEDGLMYYDQNCTSWMFLEERVQRAYLDYVAEKELLNK